MASPHFQLNQPVKIDGVDFEPGVYATGDIDAGRRGSICNAGWGDYCDAPKANAPKANAAKTNDEDSATVQDSDFDEVLPPAKPARSRKK